MLRPLRAADLDAFAAIWADPRVTAFIGATPRPRDEVWRRMLATEGHWRWLGYGYWGVERGGTLIGSLGFADFERPIAPLLHAPEAGWAFAADAWGYGFATEALLAAVAWADTRGWARTCAIMDHGNRASARVAAKAGFDFSHDALMGNARLATHVRHARR